MFTELRRIGLLIAVAQVTLFLVVFVVVPVVQGQYIQRWQWETVNGVQVPTWRPTTADSARPIILLDQGEAVYLEYNCFYLKAICQNARSYLISAVNKERQWRTAFTYDLDKIRGDGARNVPGRRNQVCNWSPTDVMARCPERAAPGNLAQPAVMRNHDTSLRLPGKDTRPPGTLPAVGLEPGSRLIMGYTDVNGNNQPSGLTYTCDEFPAAKWIEGGNGVQPPAAAPPEGRGEVAYTRCAPQRYNCGSVKGFNSEQDWQGWAHNRLRKIATAAAENYLRAQPGSPKLDMKRDAVVFFFRMTSSDNGIAARVIHHTATGTEAINNQLPTRSTDKSPISPQHHLDWADSFVLNYSSPAVEMHELLIEDPSSLLRRSTILPEPFLFEAVTQANDTRSDDRNVYEEDNTLASSAGTWRVRKRPQASKNPVNIQSKPDRLTSRAVARHSSSESRIVSSPLLRNATVTDINKARKIVAQAIDEMADHNKRRVENPSRNHYTLKSGASNSGSGLSKRTKQATKSPALLKVTPEIAAAAALIAELDAAGNSTTGYSNSTAVSRSRIHKRGSFWMEKISRKGTVPWGNDPSYKVFRNVLDYGARGDGVTDDTEAIRKAMFDGKRCGEKCNGSTTKNAIVYFPPGVYLVSGTIPVIFGTQLIGDANNWPTIKAAASFIGLGVLSTDEYVPNGGTGSDGKSKEWYINTASFYRQIRNFKIDITATNPGAYVCAIHYQIAQATSLQFVELIADSGTTQQGIFSENGSGGVLADITFRGGNFGFYGGNQQFTAQRLKFIGCKTAVQVIWDWGWVWKSISVKDATVGFRLLREQGSTDGNIGSASFMDSSFTNVGTAVIVGAPSSNTGSGTTGLVLENVDFSNVNVGVADSSSKNILAGGSKHIAAWAIGPVYTGGERSFSLGKDVAPYSRERTLLDVSSGVTNAPYFERAKPQYEDRGVGDFIHLKDVGAKGDGVTDDTAAFQSALDRYVGKILFVDAGTYILTRTVTVPVGTKLVGETWSQFAAQGNFFSDANNPQVMLKVGKQGDVGDIEMQDLLFTTKGNTAGAIIVEWNIKASSQGAAGIWDCHARIGGATGTNLNSGECPPITSGTNPNCQAASLMMHVTSKASGYFENMWLWVADHEIDDPKLDDADNDMTQVSVYVARGFLIESQEATWLYGTASEHSVFYQYSFHKAKNVFAGMIQTETPYYQPVPKPPMPFERQVGRFVGDPDYSCKGGDFDGCDSSWAVIITGSQNIFVAGAGLYSWFDTYAQDCIDKRTCQKALVLLHDNFDNIRMQHLITIGAKYSVVSDGSGILAADNEAVTSHPRWSQITIFDVKGTRKGHVSPEMATVIPMAHTTVRAGQTFTISSAASTDIVKLPNDGKQNSAPGPGSDVCTACSFFRLITSTCCGTGGSIGNPILIPAGVPVPIDIPLPARFVPPQAFISKDGESIPAAKALFKETIIPRGTKFDKDFAIPSGQPLRDGEDVDESIVWVSPDIWSSQNPIISCQPPCTLMLPPWPNATSTIDYPRITVTEGTLTSTITYPPITVTEWDIESVTIGQTFPIGTTSSSTTDIIGIIIPTLSTTTTWPIVRWTDHTGEIQTTRPTSPPHPLPPGPNPPAPPPPPKWIDPPRITIHQGPPGPTTQPCAFRAAVCPPETGPPPPGPGGSKDSGEDPSSPDEEGEEDEPDVCFALPSGTAGNGGNGSSSPSPSPTPSPTPTPKPTPTPNQPKPSENKKSCYDSGQWVTRGNLVPLITRFCKAVSAHKRLKPGFWSVALNADYDVIQAWGWVEVVMSIEVLDGCEWNTSQEECERYMRVLVDSCDCSGVNYKKGGTLSNNCLKWRLDPGAINSVDYNEKKEDI